jgi:hypothetical protein
MPPIMNSIERGHAARMSSGMAPNRSWGATIPTISPTTANPATTFQLRHIKSIESSDPLFGGAFVTFEGVLYVSIGA